MKTTKLMLTMLGCGLGIGGTANAAVSTTTFGVTANIVGACTVTADDMDFGDVDLDVGSNTSSFVYVNCPVGVNGYMNLGEGLNEFAGFRYVAQTIGPTKYTVQYDLYSDAARTQPFVAMASVGTGGVAITGKGISEAIEVFGTIPIQDSKPAGQYNDTVGVVINY
jgi:hypothetical protein